MKIKKVVAVLLVCAMAISLAACGKVATVSINDDGLKTELETKLPAAVGKILEQAGITLGESDVVTPGINEKLSEGESILIERMHTVKLTVAGNTQTLEVVGGTVADLLEAGGVTLADKQLTNYDLTEPLKEGMEVQVLDQMTVSVVCDGETKSQAVSSTTVSEAIKEFGITLGEDDEVTPGVDQKVTEGLEIVIDRVKYEEKTEVEVIPFEVETAYDATLGRGTEYTTVSGEDGEVQRIYRVKFVNGEEVETELVEEKVTKEPVNAVVVIGPYVVSRVAFPNCDDGSHGYYEVTYSDGSKEYIDY